LKNGQKLKLGDAHVTPKKYPRSTSIKAWGCPRGTPSSSAKIRSPFKTLYFYCFMHYAFFLERQISFGEGALLFICKNTLFFTLIVQRVFSFLLLRLAFIFRLDLCSDLVLSLYQGVFLPLVHVGFHQKS
jgi:hypothetical protein